MAKTKYFIGSYKNGQDFAQLVDYFGFETENQAVEELIKMYNTTEFDEDDFDNCLTEADLLEHKRFSYDTTNWGVFKLSENTETGEIEPAITRPWGGRNFKSNQI